MSKPAFQAALLFAISLTLFQGCSDLGQNPPAPNLDVTVSTGALNFGYVAAGGSAQLSFTVTNNGNDSLAVTHIDDDHAETAAFTTDFDNMSGAKIAPAASVSVAVTFAPQSSADYSAKLTIQTDHPDFTAISIDLSGTSRTTWSGFVGPLFAQRCTPCHITQSQAGYNLSTYASALSGGRIIPGDAVGSLIIMKLEGRSTPRMPLGGPYLSQDVIDRIKDWINAGALDN